MQPMEAITAENILEYERLLCQLQGVLHSRFVLEDENTIAELHIIANMARQPKQLVRDIQSLMMARFNLNVDHKIISIAQISSEDYLEPTEMKTDLRLSCSEISFTNNQNTIRARVVLTHGNQEYIGTSTGTQAFFGKPQIMADTTVNALNEFTKDNNFSLIEVRHLTMANQPMTVVAVAYKVGGSVEYLLGTAFVKDDPYFAVVKAVLDAVNRKVATLVVK